MKANLAKYLPPVRAVPMRVTLAAAAVLLTAGAAEARICASPSEQAALRARVVQSQLMVAALSCGARPRYNAFVRKFERELVMQGKSLRSFFQRTYGDSATKRLNSFVTSQANKASERSLDVGGAFCSETAGLFDELQGLRPVQFTEFVARQRFAASHGIESCPTQSALPKSQ